MSSFRTIAASLFAALLFGGATSAMADEAVTIALNQARILRMPEKTKTIVIGNPMIADVTMQKNNNLVLTGKAYGLTNLIALDEKGNIVAESRIRVDAGQDSVLIVQRGMDRESYSCAPICQPTISPGDGAKYFGELATQAEKHNTLSSPK
jgi:hypothetical protein